MTVLSIQQAELLARQALSSNQPQQAEILARALLAKGNGPVHVWSLLATALRRQGRLAEAKDIIERLVEAAPHNFELHFDLAEVLLLLGEFDRGWQEYRFRYNLPHTLRLERKVQAPRWDGQKIAGKTLLIHDEQGFGDTLQFMRMVPWAKEKSGARVVLQISPELASFARRMTGDAVVMRGDLPPRFDLHCEMMSLPMAMGLRLGDLPGSQMPYLAPDPARVTHWRKRLSGIGGLRVALVWAGRPDHFNDANRSISLSKLALLAAVPGLTFLSVQKGPKAIEAQTPPTGMTLINLSEEIRDFEDTAAILTTVDLLISVDSSPVHLAGALGRPAWVMLPFVPDWRWLQERSDTPWYPSLRLFRQPKTGDWDNVVTAMANKLAHLREPPPSCRQIGTLTDTADAGLMPPQSRQTANE